MCVVCQGNNVKNNNIWISCNLLYSFIFIEWSIIDLQGFSGGSVVKNLPANAGHAGSIPGLGRSPGEGNDDLLHYSCLRNPMDRGAWLATVHRSHKRLRHDLLTKQQEVDLQCHVSFRCTAKWFNYMYMCVYIYIYTHSFRFFSHIGYYKILSVVPCAIESVLVVYLFFT